MRMKILTDMITELLSDSTTKCMLVILGLIFAVNVVVPLILRFFDVDEFLKKTIKVIGTILILVIGLPIAFAPSGGYRSIGHFFTYVGNGIKDMFIFAVVIAVVVFIGGLFSPDEDTKEKAGYKMKIDTSSSGQTCRNCLYFNHSSCLKYRDGEYMTSYDAENYGCNSFVRNPDK